VARITGWRPGPGFLFGLVGAISAAACPVSFQTQSAASLTPTASSHIVLLRQNSDSFTGYEVQNVSPFTVMNTNSAFLNQLTVCPPPPSGLPPSAAPPQAFAQLTSGGYLFLQRSDLFGPPGANESAIYTMQFTSALSLVSQSTITLATSGIASTLALTDVNGDGVPDIVARATYASVQTIQVLLGKGGTSFQSPVSYPVSELSIQGVALADVNGDGKLDIVIVGSGPTGPQGEASVLLGNGDGTFQTEKVVLTSNAGNFLAIAVADLNGDGKPDLAITVDNAASQTTVLVALGNGDGTFATPVSYPSGGSGSIAIADVNGDGFPDIVAADPNISILFGDGTGAFPNRRGYVQQTLGNIILTDFNSDGETDILIGTGASWVLGGTAAAVLYGNGNGTFSGSPYRLCPGTPLRVTARGPQWHPPIWMAMESRTCCLPISPTSPACMA
jgi:FG-GAP-like repeat/FG-GAP repeat